MQESTTGETSIQYSQHSSLSNLKLMVTRFLTLWQERLKAAGNPPADSDDLDDHSSWTSV